MQEQDYLKDRVDDQIKWLSAKSGWNQRWFKCLRLTEIALGGLIPVIVAMPINDEVSKAIAAGAGALIAVIAAAVSLWRFQEIWVQYRATSEALKREKMLYLANADPYNKPDRFPLFVNRVEALLAAENSHWVELAKAKPVNPNASGSGNQ